MTEKQVEAFFKGFKRGFETGRRRALDEILFWLEREIREIERSLKQTKNGNGVK